MLPGEEATRESLEITSGRSHGHTLITAPGFCRLCVGHTVEQCCVRFRDYGCAKFCLQNWPAIILGASLRHTSARVYYRLQLLTAGADEKEVVELQLSKNGGCFVLAALLL